VEYLSPPEMKGQFFLLKEDFLYQFMPGQNLIIKKDLKNSNVPVRAANLTPNYLLELVRSEELEVNLIGSPGELTFPWIEDNVLELETSLSGQETTSSKSLQEWGLTTPVSFGSESDYYVLEIIPREEGYQFARQVIRFDPETLLPHELVTYFEDQARDPVTTGVEQVRTNVGLDLAEIEKLPEDAEIISD